MTEKVALDRASLPAQIKAHLLEQITTGVLKPGDRLIELKIAADMDTSQAPVREALRELEAIGIVETRRNKGARVRVMSDSELRDIYDVRAELEGYAAETAARNGKRLEKPLSETLALMAAAARKDDAIAFATHNTAFHRVLVEASANSVLLDHWERLDVQFRTAINMARLEMDLVEAVESHRPIIAAIIAEDPDLSRRLAKTHVLSNKPGSSND